MLTDNTDINLNNHSAEGDCFVVVVQDSETGLRLDKWLTTQKNVPSRAAAQRALEAGLVTKNGQRSAQDARVQTGDSIRYQLPTPTPTSLIAKPGPLDVVYEDQWLIVVNKPCQLTVHPAIGHWDDTLLNRLVAYCGTLAAVGGVNRPGVVHRLDKDTSGLLVLAKDDETHIALAAQFKARHVKRYYLALAFANPAAHQGSIDLPLRRDSRNRLKYHVHAAGKHALTRWRILWRRPPFALFRLKLETGRTHQIRVHLSHHHWPILGDPLYGQHHFHDLLSEPILSAIQQLKGQALHARSLGFFHPILKKRMHFFAPLRSDFQQLLNTIHTESALHVPQ